MIVTIDGHSGAGKSSVAILVANKLGFKVLYSGLIYRAFASLVYEYVQIDNLNDDLISSIVRENLDFLKQAGRGELESERFRSFGDLASKLSACSAVRNALLSVQRTCYLNLSFVAEGRDMGTVVFPEAEYKFFIDCSLSVKLKRFLKFNENCEDYGLIAKHDLCIPTAIEILERDLRDSLRAVAPTRKSREAFFILNDDEIDKTVDEICRICRGAI
ncbi:MAG: (d)CMP kinase [Deltaproteobacteria bacterium]|nr:(d)CMP kinase [Deltaproteobacteria bacterium]